MEEEVGHLAGEGAGEGVVGRLKYALTISRTEIRVMRSMTAAFRELAPIAASMSAHPLVPSSAVMYTSMPSRTNVRMLAVARPCPAGVPDQAQEFRRRQLPAKYPLQRSGMQHACSGLCMRAACWHARVGSARRSQDQQKRGT